MTRLRRPLITSAMTAALVITGSGIALASWSNTGAGSGALKAVSMPTGPQPTATASGKTVMLSWTQSTLTGSMKITTYTVKRNGTAIICPTTVTNGTVSCSDTNLNDGSYSWTVTPTYDTWKGTAGTAGTATVDTTAPTPPAIASPASGVTYYSAASGKNQTQWPGSFSGAPGTDSGSGVKEVDIQLSYVATSKGTSTTLYWDPSTSTFTSSAKWINVGTTWSYSFPAANFVAKNSYTVSAQTVDNAGNTSTATQVTFTFQT